ncbi:MAG: isochorismatase family protein [Christensenellaceae bacterium]|nr:isochorismatase family protein [Christensenellaceae bacterium]
MWLLSGFWTEVCVTPPALAAMRNGCEVHIVADARHAARLGEYRHLPNRHADHFGAHGLGVEYANAMVPSHAS